MFYYIKVVDFQYVVQRYERNLNPQRKFVLQLVVGLSSDWLDYMGLDAWKNHTIKLSIISHKACLSRLLVEES